MLCSAVAAYADNYQEGAISYNHESFYASDSDLLHGGMNGFGLGYKYGIGITKLPMFIEVGGQFNFNFDSNTEKEDDWKDKASVTHINLNIPVSYAYKFDIGNEMAIKPYVGLDFKFNMMLQGKFTEYYKGEETYSNTVNFLGTGEHDWNYKVFQMGWHTGVSYYYQKYTVGINYGNDFTPIYKDKYDKVNTSTFNLTVGYAF